MDQDQEETMSADGIQAFVYLGSTPGPVSSRTMWFIWKFSELTEYRRYSSGTFWENGDRRKAWSFHREIVDAKSELSNLRRMKGW